MVGISLIFFTGATGLTALGVGPGEFYLVGGVALALAALTVIVLVAVPRHPVLEEGSVHLGHAHHVAPQAGVLAGAELTPAMAEAKAPD